jgi:hypothetical protein
MIGIKNQFSVKVLVLAAVTIIIGKVSPEIRKTGLIELCRSKWSSLKSTQL